MERKHHHSPYVDRPGLSHVPGALNKPQDLDLAGKELYDQIHHLVGENPVTPEKAEELAALFVDRLPEEMRTGLKQEMEVFKNHVAREVLDLMGTDTNISEERIRDAITAVQLELMAHHAQGIKLMAPLHEFGGQPPEKVEKHFVHSGRHYVLKLARLGGYATISMSAITSTLGGRHFAGEGIQYLRENVPFFEQLDLLKDPYVQEAIAGAFGAAAAGVVTFWALRVFKEAMDEIAYSDDKSLGKAGVETIGRRFHGNVGQKLVAGVFLGALTYDVVSNADGFITLSAGSFDDAKQLKVAEGHIDDQKEAIRKQLQNLPESIREQVNTFAQDTVQAEIGGTAATKKGGAGPMAAGKIALLTDENTGLQDLSVMEQKGGTWGTIAGAVNTSVRSSGLIGDNNSGIGPDFYNVSKGVTDQVETDLSNIDALEESLSSSSGTAVNQARIEKIQAQFKEIQSLVGPDGKLKVDLEAAREKYNKALTALGEIARSNPSAYPRYEAGAMQEIKLPEIKIDVNSIEIPNVTFKSSIELISELASKPETVPQAIFWFLLSYSIAMLMSYGNEMVLGNAVRKTHVADRRKITEERNEYVSPLLEGLVNTFDVLMNGMYMRTGKTEPIHPNAIRAEILTYLKEKAEEGKPKGWIAEHRRAVREGILFGKGSVTGHTEEANEFNNELSVLAELFNGPEAAAHLKALFHRMLPNISMFNESGTNGVAGEVTRSNNELLKDQNIIAEKEELDKVESEIPELKGNDSRKVIMDKMRRSVDILKALTQVRKTQDVSNREQCARIEQALENVWKEGENLLETALAKVVRNIVVQATHKSIEDSQTKLGEIDAEWIGYQTEARHKSGKDIRTLDDFEAAKTEKQDEIGNKEQEVKVEDEQLARREGVRGEYQKTRDSIDALKRRLSLWWDGGRAAHETPLEQANMLLALLGSEKILTQHETLDMTQEDEAFAALKGRLQAFKRVAESNNDPKEVEEITDWIGRLDTAHTQLDKFVSRT